MAKPTDEEIEVAVGVIEWLRNKTENEEPWAEELIASCTSVIENMPEY